MKYLRKINESSEFEKFDIEEIKSYFHTLTDIGVELDLYYGFGSEDLSHIRPNSLTPMSDLQIPIKTLEKEKTGADGRGAAVSYRSNCNTPIVFAYVSLKNTKWNEFEKIADFYNGLAEVESRLSQNYIFKISKSTGGMLFDFIIIIGWRQRFLRTNR